MSRQARSLDVLLAEVNAAAGRRSKVSDGGLGDPAHASRVSDHNANAAGVWRARDFTDDDVDDNHDGGGDDVFDCDAFAERLVAMYHATDYGGRAHPAMRSGAYTIWKSRIYSYDRRDEGWRPYSGLSPHDKHLHQSVATAASGYDSTAPWGVMEDDMANSDEILSELKALRGEERARAVLEGKRAVRDVAFMKVVRAALTADDKDRDEILGKLDGLIVDVEALAAEVQ